MAETVTLFGIPNCDQVRRARGWLLERGVDYRFHDFRRDGLDAALATRLIDGAGPAQLINRRGTTWRALDAAQKAAADSRAGAGALMMAHPGVVRRPVLVAGARITVGFDAAVYARVFP